ncbi:ATP-binding cassette transporter [Aspergillus eucalypticola CBS 122712]|uniref:ATP-binding cassette transporter n=1 Tax=Aspergillus eucalypticola (strain CBS 122712 / IBT 29274) TaxID=1448314 RepID=A0A317WBI8_ASPEC|nr:ATP-binding cassette transporter [Aspergillus eucalypticola CBS 122712]PWY82697.1 ATP-binding cassette transporter [Aspergillus eucalypticola CBS 122712]
MACASDSDNFFGPRVSPECRSFDFTLLFEDSFFGLLPAALFLVLVPQRLQVLRNSQVKLNSFRLAVVKLILLGVLLVLHIMYTALRVEDLDLHTRAGLASGIVHIIATGAAILLSFFEDQRSVKPSDLLVVYYSAEVLLSLPQLRSLWQIPTASVACRALWTTILIFNVGILISESTHKFRFLRPMYQKRTEEGALGFWCQSFFIWVLPVLQNGYSKVLGIDDIPEMDADQRAQSTQQELEKAWAARTSNHRLLRSTFYAYRRTFLSAIVPRLCLSAFSFCQPFLITATIDYIQNDKTSDNKNRGQAIVGAYVLVYLGWAISTAVYWRQTNRFNTKVRSGLISMVFNQTSRLKASDINDSAAITLMGTDVERIVQSQKTIHETWASVLEVGIAIWLLERQLLIACVVPGVIAIVSVLAIGPISNRSGQAQKLWVECVQTRVTETSSMLRDIKSIKMLGLTQVMFQTLSNLRKIELKTSERFRRLLIWEIVISNVPTDFAPFATFAIYTIIAVATHNKTLLSSQAFTSLSLISLVTNPLITFIQSIPAVRQAMACYLRIEEYCAKQSELFSTCTGAPTSSSTHVDIAVELQSLQPKSGSENVPISFERANIAWSKSGENKLHDITLRVRPGVTILTGPVGSGKSTLLSSLLGETVVRSGDVQIADSRLAYCSQVPWIIDDTVRQNIILGSLFDPKWYEVAIWACGLKEELSNMPGGDLYRAGTDGLSLSGGQKQRIALCRAIYSRKRFVVLDDVFSGLDPNNTSMIATRLFGQGGYIRKYGMTVLLATHTELLLQYADEIVVLEGGRIVKNGSFKNVMQLQNAASADRSPVSTVDIPEHEESTTQENEANYTAATPLVPDSPSPLRREGTWSVYRYYYQSAGFVPFATCLAFVVVEATSGDFKTLWIKWWVEANERSPNKDVGMYLGIYALLFVIQLVSTVSGLWLLIINMINNTALNLHTDLLSVTLSAPFRFFQDTEIGALTNRFSQDMELIDMMLPLVASMFLTGLASCVVKLVIICIVSKYLAVAVPALLVSLVILQRYYLRTSRQVRLLDLEAKAPLYTHFTEAVHGVTTLRAFGMQHWFQEKMHMLLNNSQRPFYMLYCIQQWLTLVMGLIVAALAVIIVAMTTSLADQYNGAAVGVALSLLLTFNSTISSTLRSWTSLETTIGAVSRVQRYVQDTPREVYSDPVGSVIPRALGHSQFSIAFDNVTAGYGQASPPVLKNLSLTIQHGQKIAICGASGSGKSSIIMSLLRMSEIQSGKISIGGCDISELERQAIHAAINVIPQDPFLLSGTVRFNLDPFGMATDERITSGLQKVDLWSRISAEGGLDMDMSSISTWSVGERQLFALARALVVPRPILILDEATSSVDRETEAFMHEIIEQNFRHQTVIAVIHRFAYIDRFDRVAFLKDGEMLECDAPQALLGRDCNFRQLYRAWERA